jgi:hypothetical protein
MTKKTFWIVFLQTLIIIVLFWMLVFYGRDEYETFQSEQEEEESIEGPQRVFEKDGINLVKLSLATQNNSGIQTQALRSTAYEGKTKALGTVVSIQPLLDASTQYQQLKSQLNVTNTAIQHHQQQYQRYAMLNADDKNVSDKVVQEAQALVKSDQAQITALTAQMQAAKSAMTAQWGHTLTNMMLQPNAHPVAKALLNQQKVLVQVSLPLSYAEPKGNTSIELSPINLHNTLIKGQYLGVSTQSDISNTGKTYFFSAPAQLLRIGMRLNAIPTENEQSSQLGVLVPNTAIVWHAGMPWVYVKQGKDTFLRKPIALDTELDDGWFEKTLSTSDTVVTRGAQLLLSEEFKFLIKNENDD